MKHIRELVIAVIIVLVSVAALLKWLEPSAPSTSGAPPDSNVIEVSPGEDIQQALETAARRPIKPIVRVKAGTDRKSVV